MGHEQVISAIHKRDPADCSRLPRLVASKGSAAEAPNAWWLRGREKCWSARSHWQTVQRLKPRNRLLAVLPHEVLSSLRPHLKPVSLPRGRGLCDVDEPLRRVYFVEAGVVSMVSVFEEGGRPRRRDAGAAFFSARGWLRHDTGLSHQPAARRRGHDRLARSCSTCSS